MKEYVSVEGHSHLARDEESTAIVNTDIEQCPFLENEENVRKIRKAKEIILNHITEPPTLQDLASEIGLNLKKLKEMLYKFFRFLKDILKNL